MPKIIKPLKGENSDFPFQNDSLLFELIQNGLNIRKSGDFSNIHENTYLRDLPIPQIVLFDALANDFPLVQCPQAYLNDFYRIMVEAHTSIQILDLGIGRGFQMGRLLKNLNGLNLRGVRLIGTDISKDAIDFTFQNLRKLKDQLDFELELHLFARPFEELNQDFFKENILSDPLIINASLSLHHIRNIEKRNFIIKMIGELKPLAFGLIEPNVESFQTNFGDRFNNISYHFGALFQYIDGLKLSKEIRDGIKRFLGNELIDGIAYPDDIRCENYDPIYKWYKNFLNYGLKPVHLPEIIENHLCLDNIELKYSNSGCVEIDSFKVPLLGILTLST